MIKHPTYFVDIDGTLIKYRKFDEIRTTQPEPIQSVIDKVNSEYENGSHIVITTARPEDLKLFTINELNELGINFHQIVMGVGRGTRYVINDKDPKHPDVDRAVGINLERNKGL
jgi:hydroxymethylpyrimidine pyrophosphatase-like HAD family hydrolase